MEYRFMGRTGLEVSELCLGTLPFGSMVDRATSFRMLDEFVEAGGTFIDTADVYGHGRSEETIGTWLKNRSRDDLVLATKIYGEAGPGRPVRGAGRKHILTGVEDSLRRLGTDFIDLYQIHVFDDATPYEETLSTLDGLVRSGKVRFIGASNYAGRQLQKSIDLSCQHGWEPFTCLQPLYNLMVRDAEWELLEICRAEGAGVIAWSPLNDGWLSGKYRRGMDGPPAGTRVADAAERDRAGAWERWDNEQTWQLIDTVLAVAEETGRSPAQVALRWVLQQPGVTAPIVGARTPEQLRDNLGTTGWALDRGQLDRLDAISARPLPYPYELQRLPQFRRRVGRA